MSGCLQGKRLYFCNYVKKSGPQLWQRSKFKKTRTRDSKIIKAKPRDPSSHQKKSQVTGIHTDISNKTGISKPNVSEFVETSLNLF
jgi:hypothetical protein